MLLLHKPSISLMLVAALSTSGIRSEVGFQTGLCGRGEGDDRNSLCTELEEGVTCRSRERTHEDGSTTACDEPAIGSLDGIVSRSCVNFFRGNCLLNLDVGCEEDCVISASGQDATWPRLTYTSVGVDSTNYLIDVNWSPPSGVTVPGYVLVIGGSSITNWNRCSNYDSEQCLHCIIQLDNTTFQYRHQLSNLKYLHGSVVHIKLIPSNWCDGPSVSVSPPASCYHACPGNCQRCGDVEDYGIINYPPRNVNYSICHNRHNSTYSATFQWEPGIIGYERPNPMAVFYFYLTTNGRFSGRISRHLRTQHRPVTLHNLTLEVATTYYIRIQQYECACTDFRSFRFEISSSATVCDGISTTSATSMISSTPSLRTSSTVATVPSLSTSVLNSSSNPTQDNINPTMGHNVTLPIAIPVGVAVVLLVVVIIGVLTVQHCQSAEKQPCSPSKWAQVSPKVQTTQQLLVLYSWGTSEHNQQRIMQCVANLLIYDTRLVYSAKSEVRGDIPQWVEKQICNSDKVLIVCNEQFSREWQSPGSTHTEGAIVNALKAIITGHINSGTMDKICSRTALVFLKEKHKELVPSEILHSFKQYMLCEENSDKQNELLRFISDTPLFNFCPQEEDVKVMV